MPNNPPPLGAAHPGMGPGSKPAPAPPPSARSPPPPGPSAVAALCMLQCHSWHQRLAMLYERYVVSCLTAASLWVTVCQDATKRRARCAGRLHRAKGCAVTQRPCGRAGRQNGTAAQARAGAAATGTSQAPPADGEPLRVCWPRGGAGLLRRRGAASSSAWGTWGGRPCRQRAERGSKVGRGLWARGGRQSLAAGAQALLAAQPCGAGGRRHSSVRGRALPDHVPTLTRRLCLPLAHSAIWNAPALVNRKLVSVWRGGAGRAGQGQQRGRCAEAGTHHRWHQVEPLGGGALVTGAAAGRAPRRHGAVHHALHPTHTPHIQPTHAHNPCLLPPPHTCVAKLKHTHPMISAK